MNTIPEGGARPTLVRHGLVTRLVHAVNALLILVLLVTGAGLGGWLSLHATALMGGHQALEAAHEKLGLLFVIAWLLLAARGPGKLARLLCDVLHFRRGDLKWPLEFLRFYLAPKRHMPPIHDGRFDPAQRMVFLGLIATVALASASGIYLYLSPPFGPTALGWTVRVHIGSVVLLIACLAIHILAGIGLPRTHRGLVGAMFGHGKVPVALAQVLWPAWARRALGVQAAAADDPSAVARVHEQSDAAHRAHGTRK